MAASKRTTSIKLIAEETGIPAGVVRNVLRESAPKGVSRTDQDKIFKVARRLGYDFSKLKIGKRMQYRKETLDEVIDKVYNHPDWGRDEIVKFLNESRAFLDRVHDKAFQEEFGKIED